MREYNNRGRLIATEEEISKGLEKYSIYNSEKVNIEDKSTNRAQEIEEYFRENIGISEIPNYKDYIKKLNEIRDLKVGIIWNLDEENRIIYRDAREVIPNQAKIYDNEEAYLIQITNIARAAELLAKAYKGKTRIDFLAKVRSNLNEIFSNKYKNNKKENITEKELKIFSAKIIDLVLQEFNIKKEEAYEILNSAKEYTSFDDDHYSIATIYNIDNKAIIAEVDIALTELTKEQQDEFAKESLSDKTWFKNLEDFEQNLIKAQLEKITDGKHVCPTQLRRLPLIRNAYKKNIYKLRGELDSESQKDKEAPELIDFYTHSGTHVVNVKNSDESRIQKESLRLTELATRQQKSFIPEKSEMIIIDLLSPITKGDNKMVKTLNEVRSEGISHINLPQNIGRNFSPYDKINIEKFLFFIVDKLEDNTKNVAKLYLKDDNVENFKKYIQNYKISTEDKVNGEIKKILNLIIDINELKKSSFIGDLVNGRNKRLEIANKIEELANYLNKPESEALKNLFGENIPKCEIIIQCKSGKDRTGVKELYNFSFSANKAISEEVKENDIIDIIEKYGVYSNSFLIPGLSQGGTSGCYGIKKAAATVFPRVKGMKSAKERVLSDNAENNNFKYDRKALKQLEYQRKSDEENRSTPLIKKEKKDLDPKVELKKGDTKKSVRQPNNEKISEKTPSKSSRGKIKSGEIKDKKEKPFSRERIGNMLQVGGLIIIAITILAVIIGGSGVLPGIGLIALGAVTILVGRSLASKNAEKIEDKAISNGQQIRSNEKVPNKQQNKVLEQNKTKTTNKEIKGNLAPSIRRNYGKNNSEKNRKIGKNI